MSGIIATHHTTCLEGLTPTKSSPTPKPPTTHNLPAPRSRDKWFPRGSTAPAGFSLAGPWGPWMISAGRAPAGTTKYLFHKLKIFFISHKLFREALSKLKRFFRTVKLSRYNAKLSTYLHKTCFSPLCRKLSGSDR